MYRKNGRLAVEQDRQNGKRRIGEESSLGGIFSLYEKLWPNHWIYL